MKGAIIRRPLPEFGMEFAWYGDRRVVVECNGEEVDSFPLKSAGARTATEAMDRERQRMHESCVAFA